MEKLVSHLKELITLALARQGFSAEGLNFEFPTDSKMGDLATTVALSVGKRNGKNPKGLADALVKDISSELGEDVASVSVDGPGFINFFLSPKFFAKELRTAINDNENYGSTAEKSGKTILFEYTDPNAFKEFHIGHLMSNTIGEALSRLNEKNGAKVFRLCYQSDIGLNVAKAIWGMQQSLASLPNENDELSRKVFFVGNAYVLGSRQYHDDPDSKKEIDELNKIIYEQSDERVNELYRKGRAWSLEHFEEIYKILGTKFDYNYFESDMAIPGISIVKDFLAKGVFEESEGAIIYRGENDGLHTRVFVNKFGLPTYEAKELALTKDKANRFTHDQSIVITANEQNEYFKVILSALRKIDPENAEKIKHISHGMMRFVDGKMSSRAGNIVTGESLINDVQNWVREKMQSRNEDIQLDNVSEIENAVAVSAIKYSILRQSPGKDIVFDPEASLSFEGDSGPYLLYSLARSRSVLRKAEEMGVEWGVISENEITNVDRLLYRFSHVIRRAGAELSPQLVVTYLTELASAFNSWYASEKILDSGEFQSRRLALVEAFSIVMRNGIDVLGMKPLERM